MRKAFRDPVLQAQFEREGYVVRRLLSEVELDALRAAVKSAIPSDPPVNDPQQSAYVSYFDLDRRHAASDFIEAIVAPKIEAALQGYRPLYSSFFHKHGGAPAMEPHQHSPAIADPAETVVNCWIPLIDCDATSGTLEVVRRSHQLVDHVQTPFSTLYWNSFADELRTRYLRPVPVRAGDAIFFEDSLVHGSARNERGVPRVATLTAMIPVDAVPAFYTCDGAEVVAYEAADGFCYSDLVHGRLPAESDWRRLGAFASRATPVGLEEFDAALAARDGDRAPRGCWRHRVSQFITGKKSIAQV